MSGPGDGTTTYRGRSLEEVLPKIREELGPDAVIERQRTGLVGGVGGFFQREMVEVDARPPRPGEAEGPSLDVLAGDEDEALLRAATAPPSADPDRDEGLHAPGMRRIVEQSAPFAELLSDAQHDAPPPPAPDAGDDWDAWAGDDDEDAAPAPEPPRFTSSGAYTPRAGAGAPPPVIEPPAATEHPETLFPVPPPEPVKPRAVLTAERALTERGLSPELAADVLAEARSHAMPFAPPRGGLKRQARATLARRIPVQPGFGAGGRTIALVGAAGAGKTRAAAGLAAAYAAGSDLPVVCLALRPGDVGAELSELLDPHGVTVRPVADGASARAHVGARAGRALVVLDTPAASPRDRQAVAALADDLRAAGVTEVHVVLPATVAATFARAALQAYAPLDPTALLITHADETDHLGPLVDVAITEQRPLSYIADDAGLAPADPAALAARLLP